MAQSAKGNEAPWPEWIRILPRGKVELVDYRDPFEVDEAALAEMVAEFRSRGVDLVIDYEHQSLQGDRAPAAGWIKELEARDDGLWGRVEWTAQAREYLRQKEYRYFSPVLRLAPESRRPTRLMQVGLTNVPAIKGLKPLVARRQVEPGSAGAGQAQALDLGAGGGAQAMERLKRFLGLDPKADLEAVQDKALELYQELFAALDLPGEACAGEFRGALQALKAGADQALQMREELEILKSRLAEQAAAQVVEEALKAGKVTPAQRDWACEYFRRDPEGFKTYLAKAPKILPAGTPLRLIGEALPEDGGLAPEELALCHSLNLTPEAYLKAKARG
jgi:phage I-like protein